MVIYFLWRSGGIEIKKELTEENKEKVRLFLERVKAALATNDFVIKMTEKNKEFDREYPMRHEEKKALLNSLTVDECVEITTNRNSQYVDAEIYIFLKNARIYVYGELEDVEMYIKMYLLEKGYYDNVIVISFHREGVFDL